MLGKKKNYGKKTKKYISSYVKNVDEQLGVKGVKETKKKSKPTDIFTKRGIF